MASTKKAATFKVSYIMYLRSNSNSDASERQLEKDLARVIGTKEIVFFERKPNGEFLIITREP